MFFHNNRLFLFAFRISLLTCIVLAGSSQSFAKPKEPKVAGAGTVKAVEDGLAAGKKAGTPPCAECEAGTAGNNLPDNTAEEDEAFDKAEKKEKKVSLFFELQFLAVGNDNKMALASMPMGRINIQSAIKDYAKAKGLTGSQVLNKSDSELRTILGNYTDGLGGQKKTDAIENALLIIKASKLGSEAAILDYVGKKSKDFSFGKKVGLLATFLEAFSDNYDDDRNGDGPESKGSVGLEKMMGGIFQNISNGTALDAGVCRDMHQGAARLARAMGIDEAFTVGFRTADGGGHRTLVLTDPKNRGTVYQLNYGRVTEHTVAGPSALSQNGTIPDAGIRFRVYSAEGKPVIILPSDRGTILNLVTGGNDKRLDLLLTSNNTINQAGLATPYGNFKLFYAEAEQGNGEKVMGAAYNIKVDYNDIFYGEFGLTAFAASRETENGQMNTIGLYGQTTQGAKLTFYGSERFRLYGFGELSLRGMYGYTTLGDKSGHVLDYNISAQYGLGATYHTGPLTHDTKLTLQSTVDQKDSLDSGKGISVFTPTALLTHTVSANFNPYTKGSLTVGLGYRDLGTDDYWQYLTEARLQSEKTGTSVAVKTQGALSPDLPLWVPGSEHTGTVQVQQDIFGKHLNVGVQGNQSFETLGNHSLFFTLGGNF